MYVDRFMSHFPEPRQVVVPGCLVTGTAVSLASFSEPTYHLLLAREIIPGVRSSLLDFPLLGVKPEYSDRQLVRSRFLFHLLYLENVISSLVEAGKYANDHVRMSELHCLIMSLVTTTYLALLEPLAPHFRFSMLHDQLLHDN